MGLGHARVQAFGDFTVITGGANHFRSPINESYLDTIRDIAAAKTAPEKQYPATGNNTGVVFSGSGKPNNLESLTNASSSNLKAWYKMGEDSTFTTSWSMPNSGTGSNAATSYNMDITDKTSDTP